MKLKPEAMALVRGCMKVSRCERYTSWTQGETNVFASSLFLYCIPRLGKLTALHHCMKYALKISYVDSQDDEWQTSQLFLIKKLIGS
jgi:hypothetical protein